MTREEAIARIRDHKIVHKMNEPRAIYISEALDMAIKALEAPPNDNWEGYSKRLWKNAYERGKADAEQTDVLDKVRAEIERKAHSGQWSDATMYGMLKAVAIIDKYKAESEE